MVTKIFEIEVTIKDNHPKDDLKYIIHRLVFKLHTMHCIAILFSYDLGLSDFTLAT